MIQSRVRHQRSRPFRLLSTCAFVLLGAGCEDRTYPACDALAVGADGIPGVALSTPTLPAHSVDFQVDAAWWYDETPIADAAFEVYELTFQGEHQEDQPVAGATTIRQDAPSHSWGHASFAPDPPFHAGVPYEATFSWTCGGAPYTSDVHNFVPEEDCEPLGDLFDLQEHDLGDAGQSVEVSWDSDEVLSYGDVGQVTLRTWEAGLECWDPPCASGHGQGTGTQSGAGPLSQVVHTPPGYAGAAQVEYSCGSQLRTDVDLFWRGPSPSGPVSDPQALVGRAYGSTGRYFELLEPGGSVLRPLENTLHMNWLPMLQVTAVADDTVELAMVWTAQGHWGPDIQSPRQAPCTGPFALPTAQFDNPDLKVGPTDVAIRTAIGLTPVFDLEIHATVSADGLALQDLTFSGLFDMRDLAVELGMASVQDFCAAVADDGISCQECPDGSGPACIPVRVDGIDAYAVTDPVIEEACDLGGDTLMVWDYVFERITTSSPGSSQVSGYDFDGQSVWTLSLGSHDFAVSDLEFFQPNTVRVINGNTVSAYRYCDISPSYAPNSPPYGVLTCSTAPLPEWTWDGVSFDIDFGCTTTHRRAPLAPWTVFIVATVLALGRRRH